KVREMGLEDLWQLRYREIREFEASLSRQNIIFLKFFLNVSKEEQRKRFLKRIEDPEKNWKFSAADVRERRFWDDYQRAYEDMLSATSTHEAPWYVIPADKKWFTRACVADIISGHIQNLGLAYPKLSEKALASLTEARQELESEQG
ncbi:MAG TPA: polyphosphate kinase 2 family protein, partial [Lacipirellulaceae bacterium]|nr:polyphosphate kinase 2 family protein [Lacipirellulaceae bacterium]